MLFANNANTTLASSLTNSATTMSVTSASAFPSPTGSQYFYCTLADAATQTTIEIVKVTAVSGTTFTIVRGQDGTSGTAFASGAVVSLRLVRASLNDFPKLDEANTFTQAQTFSSAPITSTLTGFVYGNGASAQTVATNAQLLTLLGTLPVANGGTGLTSLTANYIPYGNGTSAFSSSSALTFNGTSLGIGTSAYTYTIQAQNGAAGASVGATNSGGGSINMAIASNATSNASITYTNQLTLSGGPVFIPSNGLSIGNTTDPGAGNLLVNGSQFIGTTSAINSGKLTVNGKVTASLYSNVNAAVNVATGAGAVTITGNTGLVLVAGGISGNNFWDLVICQAFGSSSVIGSATYGSPPTRTYASSSGSLTLSLSGGTAGTYAINYTPFTVY